VPQRKLIVELETYIAFLESQRQTDPEVWFTPLAPGKWSIHDIVAHIMMWDRHFLSERMRGIEAGHMVLLQEQDDYQTFNDRAVAVGRRMSKEQLIDEATRSRSELVNHVRRLDRSAFGQGAASGNGMSLIAFLQQMFVDHDKHHMEQIEGFLADRGT
jgi:hypothetical protein